MSLTTQTVMEEFGRLTQLLFDEKNAFLAAVPTLRDSYQKIVDQTARLAVATDSKKKVNLSNALRSYLKEISQTIRDLPLNDLILEGHALRNSLGVLKDEAELLNPSSIERLQGSIGEFLGIHERFRVDFDLGDAYRLLVISDRLSQQLEVYEDSSEWLVKQLSRTEVPEGYERLELSLLGETNVRSLAAKISAIQAIYSELCGLGQVSEAEFPLRIARLEAGSFIVWLLGKLGLMKLFRRLAERYAEELFRQFTRRGQVEDLRAEVDLVTAFAELSDTLEEHDIYVPTDREHLEEASEQLNQRFMELFAGETKVEVDDTTLEAQLDEPIGRLPTPPRLLESGGEKAREYRRRTHSDVWHWCTNCSNWPETGFQSQFGTPETGRLDRECTAKVRNAECDPLT